MTPQNRFTRILTLLHEAAFDDVHWLAAARLINEVSQTKSNFLTFSERRRDSEVEVFFVRSTEVVLLRWTVRGSIGSYGRHVHRPREADLGRVQPDNA